MTEPTSRSAEPSPSGPGGEPADALAERKAALRERLLAARAGLSASWRAEASAVITAAVRGVPEVAGARTALGYAAIGSEVDLDPLLRAWLADGVAVHLPFVDGDDLGIAPVVDLDADCAPGWGGVREPDPARRVPADPQTLDVAVAPGVGFDESGYRLGYGGGHFDRLLARVPAATPTVGVAFSAQVVEELPTGPHDVPVDVLVTEEGVRRPRR
jgi:5-formyltetrahydrofolate cyclo-ligase